MRTHTRHQIVQLLGAFVFAGGVISLFLAILGKDVAPRGLDAIFAAVRIGAGIALLSCVRSGLNLIALIFAVYLIVEGIFAIYDIILRTTRKSKSIRDCESPIKLADGTRSMNLDDIDQSAIALIEKLAPNISDPERKAFFNDLLWIKAKSHVRREMRFTPS